MDAETPCSSEGRCGHTEGCTQLLILQAPLSGPGMHTHNALMDAPPAAALNGAPTFSTPSPVSYTKVKGISSQLQHE